MNVLSALLIVAINPGAPIEARDPGAIEVFHCPFDASWDKNFDRWPDEWRRHNGPGFPRYVKAEISDEPAPAGKQCLRIDLNGGAAAAYSPPIRVGPLYTYVLEGLLATEGLEHDRACLSLTLLDQERHRLETFYSEKVRDSQGWKKTRLGPVTLPGDDAWFAVIGLHVEPGSRADLTGSVRFDDVWLGRLPRIALSANNLHHVFTDPGEITVTCNASGFCDEDPPVVFRLEDVSGAVVAEQRQRLKTSFARGRGWLESPGASPEKPAPVESLRSTTATLGSPADFATTAGPEIGSGGVSEGRGVLPDAAAGEAPPLVGSAQWNPPVPGPGFYRVLVTVHDRNDVAYPRELDLAVIDRDPGPSGGEFGWSLPQGDKPLPLAELSPLVGQAGIGWVKYPLWLAGQAGDREVQEVARFSRQLTSQGIELVGLLDDPPETLRSRFQHCESLAEVFAADSSLWSPSLEAAVALMPIQVRWWQLGQDTDTSFVGHPKLAERIGGIKGQLERLIHDVNVGFGWDWRTPLPEPTGGEPPWRFLALSADPPLGHQELSARLAATQQPHLRRWVVLEPLPRGFYPLPTRATDLVRQMMAAKIHGAEGIFVADPFRADRGLMNDDGTAGELFLPWRTTALMLREAECLGSIQLPGASQNHVFARGADAVMAVWNDTPAQEVVYLGRDVRQVDLWGRSSTPRQQDHRQVLEVGPLPTFVTGVDEKIVRWRQSFSLASDRLSSAVGPQPNGFRLENRFNEEVTGHLKLVVPDSWEVNPRRTDFRLLPEEKLERPFQIVLPYDVTSGRHPIRVDFELRADRTHRFSVYRHLEIGPSDVHIEVVTRLNERKELEVEQHFVNDTQGPVSFRCHLFAPDRRIQNTQIVGLDRGREVNTYRLPDGEQLIGKTLWLRAEQINGPRVLNYHFVAKG